MHRRCTSKTPLPLLLLLLLLLLQPPSCRCVFFYDEQANHTLDLRMGRKQVESALRSLEAHRFREALALAREAPGASSQKGVDIRGFYHTSLWRGGDEWKAVMREQLGLLDGKREHLNNIYDRESSADDSVEWGKKLWPSLLRASDRLHVTVAGARQEDLDKVTAFVDELGLAHRDRLAFVFNETVVRGSVNKMTKAEKEKLRLNQSEGESATFMALHDYCTRQEATGRNAFVYYFHLKGACCTRRTEKLGFRHVTTWREAMNAFVLEHPSICLRALLEGYDSCGMENQGGTYSGNFFWARCDHVARLPSFTAARFDAYQVEYAIQKYSPDAAKNEEIGGHCGFSAYNCEVDHYKAECPRTQYLHKLMQYMQSQALPYNFDGQRGERLWSQKTREFIVAKPAILETCQKRRERPL